MSCGVQITALSGYAQFALQFVIVAHIHELMFTIVTEW